MSKNYYTDEKFDLDSEENESFVREMKQYCPDCGLIFNATLEEIDAGLACTDLTHRKPIEKKWAIEELN